MFQAYKSSVLIVSRGQVDLYVELHGQMDRAQLNQIEVTTLGFSTEELQQLKQIMHQEWGKLSDDQEVVKVDGIDQVRMTGTAVKTIGIMKNLDRAIMIELPAERRRTKREELASFVVASLRRVEAELLHVEQTSEDR